MRRIALAAAAIVGLAGCGGNQPLGERLVEVCKAGKVMPGTFGTQALVVTESAENWEAARCYLEQAGFGNKTWERVIATRSWDGEQTEAIGIGGTFTAKWEVGTNGKLRLIVDKK